MMPAKTEFSQVWRMLFRHRRKMVVFFLSVMAATTAATFLLPASYQSQSKLFVRLGRENVTLDPTATLDQSQVVAVPQSRENEINSLIEILKSPVFAEKMVDMLTPQAILGKTPVPPPDTARAAHPDSGPDSEKAAPARLDSSSDRYRAISLVSRSLEVEAVKKSNVILISYVSPSPELSQAVVARLADSFVGQHLDLYRSSGAHHFLKEQAERVHGQLTQTEEQLRDLQNQTGLVSPVEQRQVVVTRIGRLQEELIETTSAVAASEAEVRVLREKFAALPATQVTAHTTGDRNEAADQMRAQLYALQLKEVEEKAKHGAKYPDVSMIREQTTLGNEILSREEKTREQVTTGPNRVYEEIAITLNRQEPVLASLKARAEALRAQLAREGDDLKALNDNSLRLAKLQRDVELQQTHYKKYAANLEQARIEQAMEIGRISNISIVQPATFDPKPVRPNKLLYLGVGLFSALFGSLGVGVLAERLDRSLKTNQDVRQRSSLPILAVIPHLGNGPAWNRKG